MEVHSAIVYVVALYTRLSVHATCVGITATVVFLCKVSFVFCFNYIVLHRSQFLAPNVYFNYCTVSFGVLF